MYGHSNPTIRTTEDGEQVGPKMHSAVSLLDSLESAPSKNALAVRVGPNGSSDYGNRIVNRCIRKGLISHPDSEHEDANPHGRGAITVTEKGRNYLAQHD